MSAPRQSALQSEVACPHCGSRKVETMPVDACQYFYECGSCKALLKPKPGDCCVFCSYGSAKCPPEAGRGSRFALRSPMTGASAA